jgi:polyferredoxin
MGKRVYSRRAADGSPALRRYFQAAFLLLNLWIGAQFYLFVRYCETAGRTAAVSRPPGVEGWLPITGLMNLKYVAATGTWPEIHAAGFVLFTAFLAIAFVFRKAFCSWLCPIGTISEWLWQGGRELFRRNWTVPRWLDIPLRAPKYILLGLFGYAVVRMSTDEIAGFLYSPYGVIADVKMLDFFRALSVTSAVVIVVLVVASVFVKNPWCRYLCPYGALLGVASMFSPTRIVRNPVTCIDCDKCTKACPSLIPVASLKSVRTPECTGCFECVTSCPVADALELRVIPARRALPKRALAIGIAALFLFAVGYARVTGHWYPNLPQHVYMELIPEAEAVSHPGQ